MFFCMTILLLLSGALCGAESNTRKVVRIPVFAYERMMVLDEDRNPISGYAYEYIQTIGTYAGWDIEYIPCESFSESMNKLLTGEADLFYELSYSAERAKIILFPEEPMGHEYYYLYVVKIQTTSGKIKKIENKSPNSFYYKYFKAGDRVKYHHDIDY